MGVELRQSQNDDRLRQYRALLEVAESISEVRISSGKTKTVAERSSSPPTGSIDAAKAGKKPQEPYSEQMIIQGISYADGSEWKAASND
ncbi:MAG: hypothetical protein KA368_14810 [Acidobacteria bacterium]|nr:hypothetical protein [Acidobacteriota bacterium]